MIMGKNKHKNKMTDEVNTSTTSLNLPNQICADKALQSTTDDAASSKLSAVNYGYFTDPYLCHFVKKITRRTPLINRGYYARVAALRQIFDKFFESIPNTSKVQIVNLGGGLDTTFFYVNDRWSNFVFYEADFPEIVARKSSIILRKECLWKKLTNDKKTLETNGGICLKSDKYKLVAVDMRFIDDVSSSFEACGLRSDLPTLFLCECVLVYMQTIYSDAIIKWSSEAVAASSALVVYEQINPLDAFGRTMVKNLELRGCPLLGIYEYPTIESQKKRYLTLGWDMCNIADMNDVYNLHLDKNEINRIQRLEIFDEIEEWCLIQSHYIIVVAVNKTKIPDKFGVPLLKLENIWK